MSPFVVVMLDFLLKAFCDSYLLEFQYLVELSMLDGETFLRFLPSVIGASAVCLASHTLGLEAWVSCHASLCFLSRRPSFVARLKQNYSFYVCDARSGGSVNEYCLFVAGEHRADESLSAAQSDGVCTEPVRCLHARAHLVTNSRPREIQKRQVRSL